MCSPASTKLSFGCHNLNSTISDPMAASDARISVNSGPMKFDTKNCVPANATPHSAAAGRTPFSAGHPPITRMRYAGTISETGAQMRPTPALRRSSGSLVIV